MLRSTILITLALAFAAPAAAGGPALTRTGAFEGETFEYVSSLAERGNIRIEGKFVKRGEQFSYTVKPSGLVEGFVGDTAVRFHVTRATHSRIAADLKAAAQPAFAEAGRASTAAR